MNEMLKMLAALVAIVTVLLIADHAYALNDGRIKKYATDAARTADTTAPLGTIGYAIDTADFKWVAATVGTWVAISTGTTFTGANSGTIDNGTNYMWDINEVNSAAGAEDLRFNFTTANEVTLSSNTGIDNLATALDLTLTGGVGVLDLSGSGASSFVLADADTTALVIGATDALNILTIDTADAAPGIAITGVVGQEAFHLDAGTFLFDELGTISGVLTLGAGAGALTFTHTDASVLTLDNNASALDVGSAGVTDALRYVSTDNVENFRFNAGFIKDSQIYNTASNLTLDASDCGTFLFTGATMDGFTYILPSTIAGCEFTFVNVGADHGLLLDISPNASDAIHGSCVLAASVTEFSGTDDADVGCTSATCNTGDTLTIIGDGSEGWYVKACAGIWVNN